MARTSEEIAKALGGASKQSDGGWKCRCPSHSDSTASLSLKDSRGKVLVRCHAGCSQEQVIDALRSQDLWPKVEAKASWTPVSPVPDTAPKLTDTTHPKHGKPVKSWTYRDYDGKLVGYVFRFEETKDNKVEKITLPMSWCKSDDDRFKWIWKSFGKPRPLYNLDKLAKRPKDPVAVFEGEKTADAATKLFPEYVCVAWPGGTKAVKYVDFKPLVGRDVTLWPDADEVGRVAMAAAGEILFVEGATTIRMIQVPEKLDELDKGWDVADQLHDWMTPVEEMLKSAQPFTPGGGDVVDQINRRYAFVILGGKGAVLRETKNYEENKVEVSYLSTEAFKQFYSNSRVPVGRSSVPAGNYWMTHESRRTYEGVVFAPGENKPNYYNMWKGFSVAPDPEGDWSMFREHLLQNAAQGDEEHFKWILGWFAQIIQQPKHKTGTSLSFRGTQGSGKTIIGQIFGHLIRSHYTLVMDSRLLFGQFNSHMASTLLLHCDESFWGGDPRHAGKLRGLVTSDTNWIEYKTRDLVEVANYMRLLITTNSDWVVPAASEERRFAVFDMGQGREQDKAYFIAMLRQMRDGGYAGLLHALQTFDLDSVDVGVIPDTVALRDQKETSMSDVAKFWNYCLTEAEILPGLDLGWPGEVSSHRLYCELISQLEKWGSKYRPTANQFMDELRRLVPPGSMLDVKRTRGSGKSWSLTIPQLEEARSFMDEKFRTKFTWKVDESTKVEDVSDEIPF